MRYRLLPYIYSVAWRTTAERYMPMRALAMDFAADRDALDIPNQFMYGPALLVNPVTDAGSKSRSVYLPAGPTWYDYWTGATVRGGELITASAPLETIPIYVRAGSIIPMGPELQYTDETPEDPIELRIYPGADGSFELFEDDGLTYAYEKGQYATTLIHWNDATRMLTLEERKGSFPRMLKERTFQLVVVGRNHGVGEAPTVAPDAIVRYDGSPRTIRLR